MRIIDKILSILDLTKQPDYFISMRTTNQRSDEELLELLKTDDIAAFEEIYNRYWEKLYVAAYKRLHLKEVCEEIVQDFFTKFWINRAHIDIRSSFAGYFFTAIRYQVLNYMEKEMVRTNYKDNLQFNLTNNSTEESVLLNDLTQNLDRAVKELPERCRSIFELSRNEFKSNKEIAEMLDISEKTVENQLTKALRRLRRTISTWLFTFL